MSVAAEVAARVQEQCFHSLESPVLRVTGFDTPYPPSRCEDEYLPDLDRVLDAVDRAVAGEAGVRQEFRLPDVGEGLTEAEVVAWRVAPGDTVAINDVLVEVETAKAAVELPSPFAGTVEALLVEPGRPVPVGTPIIAITRRTCRDLASDGGPTGAGPPRSGDSREDVDRRGGSGRADRDAGGLRPAPGRGPPAARAAAARPNPKRPRPVSRTGDCPPRRRPCRSPSRPSASSRATSASTCTPSPARAPAG